MSKLQYLVKTVETYEVIDKRTKGEFGISVTERRSGIHYQLSTNGVAMLSESLSECAELLKELVQVDCYNSVVRKGEKEGKINVVKNVTANVTKLDKLIEQRNSILPQQKGSAE